jgi:oxygen-independent coproporphyrinogen-3 oxidase
MAYGIYIHIPFCAYKCHFCDFSTSTHLDDLQVKYCQVLKNEIKARLGQNTTRPKVSTIFYGGGTPGLLDASELMDIHQILLEHIELLPDSEISLETNPDTVSEDKAKKWHEIGINRLSIGIQTFSDEQLKNLGRGHTVDDIYSAIKTASEADFNNINCDLMYGLPHQNLNDWKNTIDCFINLASQYSQIKHVSAYGLELSPEAPLSKMIPFNSPAYPSEQLFEEQLCYLVESTAKNGFEQYEISNFAKPNYQSKHNLNYWQQGEYYAFGVSAHRYIKPFRSSNWQSLTKYLDDYLADETSELIDINTAKTEAIMLGLRLTEGINLQKFRQTYNTDLLVTHKKVIDKLIEANFLALTGNHLRLTGLSRPVANTVIAELL